MLPRVSKGLTFIEIYTIILYGAEFQELSPPSDTFKLYEPNSSTISGKVYGI